MNCPRCGSSLVIVLSGRDTTLASGRAYRNVKEKCPKCDEALEKKPAVMTLLKSSAKPKETL